MHLKPRFNAPEIVGAFLEAQRLRQAVADSKRFNEQSLQFLKEAWQYRDLAFDDPIKTDACSDCLTHAGVAPSDAHEERVRQIRDLAEKTNDSAVKNILLSLADSYGCIEEQISPGTGADRRERCLFERGPFFRRRVAASRLLVSRSRLRVSRIIIALVGVMPLAAIGLRRVAVIAAVGITVRTCRSSIPRDWS